MIIITLAGGTAGAEGGGFMGFLAGCGVMLLGLGPFYLYGAGSRGTMDKIELILTTLGLIFLFSIFFGGAFWIGVELGGLIS